MSISNDFRSAFAEQLRSWGDFSAAQVERLASLALAQAQVESGNFTSRYCLQYNNCIGYTCYSGSKWQVGCTEKANDGSAYHAFGIYGSIGTCAYELADYIHRRRYIFGSIETVMQYASAMKNEGYFEISAASYGNSMDHYYREPDGNYSEDPPDPVEVAGKKLFKPPMVFYLLGTGILLLVWFFGSSMKKIFIRK